MKKSKLIKRFFFVYLKNFLKDTIWIAVCCTESHLGFKDDNLSLRRENNSDDNAMIGVQRKCDVFLESCG